jgi:ribonucleoside-diphosphate reductase alpha chain
MDCFATAVSLALQHGVPLRLLCEKFAHTRFDPAGFSSNPDIPRASSLMDYLFRWLQAKYLPDHQAVEPGQLALTLAPEPVARPAGALEAPAAASGHANGTNGSAVKTAWVTETDAPTCHECGSMMVRSGACHKCLNCGATSGCS